MASPTPISDRRSHSDIARPLPHYFTAEKTLLGVFILNNAALAATREQISATDFFLPEHATIFATMIAMLDSEEPVDAVTLTQKLHALGQLERCGGPAFISSLGDGIPHAMNVQHYAKIVREKATLRGLIHAAEAIQERAFEGRDNADDVLAQAEEWITAIGKRASSETNPATVIGLRDLLTMEMPPLEFVFEPFLTVGGTAEMYGWRGAGKSMVATWMALRIAAGRSLLFPHPHVGGNWPIRQRSRVLYVYGEMHGQMIRTRAWQMARGEGMEYLPDNDSLGIMCKDFQKSWRPNLSMPQNRKYIEKRVAEGNYKLLFLDNLSTLWPASGDSEGDRDATLSDWYNDLNQSGVSVIFLHHAGKGGTQRGGSGKEDMLDSVLRLVRPANKKDEKELFAEISQEKCRAECHEARWLQPFELNAHTVNDTTEWLMRPARNAQIEAAFAMFRDGMKPGDILEEVGIKRSTAYKYRKMFEENPDSKHWTGTE